MMLAMTTFELLTVVQTVVMGIGAVLTFSIWLGGRYQAISKTEETVGDLPERLDRLRADFEMRTEAMRTSYHTKLNEVNVLIGRLATRHEVDVLRADQKELRARFDAHLDKTAGRER